MRRGDAGRLQHLRDEQGLARRALVLGFGDHADHVLGKLPLDVLDLQALAVRMLDPLDRTLEVGDLRVDLFVLRDVVLGFGLRRQRHFGFDIAEQRRLELVVVLLRNRIELVVVAPRAVDRQPERAFADRADDLVEVVVAPLGVVLLAEQDARSHAEKAGGDQAVVGPAVHLVAGDLLDQKPVVRLVLVERLDHVVAVAPRVGTMCVVFEAARISVTGDVQPHPAVALAVVRRRQQPVDQMLPRAPASDRRRTPRPAPASAAARADPDRRGERACGGPRAAPASAHARGVRSRETDRSGC